MNILSHDVYQNPGFVVVLARRLGSSWPIQKSFIAGYFGIV